MASFLSEVIVLKIASFVEEREEGRVVNNRLNRRGYSEGKGELWLEEEERGVLI